MTQPLALLLINQEYPAFHRAAQLGALSLLRVLAPGLQQHMGSKLSRAYGHGNLFDQFTADNLATNLGRESNDVQDTTTILRLIFRFEDMAQRLELAHIVGWLRGELDEARSEVAMQMLVICITELQLQLSTQIEVKPTPEHSLAEHADELAHIAQLSSMTAESSSAPCFAPLPDMHWLREGILQVAHMETGLPQEVDLGNPNDPSLLNNPQVVLATHLRKFIDPDNPPFEDVEAFIVPLFQLVDVAGQISRLSQMENLIRPPSLEDVYPRDPQHWIYQPLPTFPPMGMRTGLGHNPTFRYALNKALVEAVHYAIQIATRGGTELPLDVDRIVQNTMVGLFGFNTTDGLPEGAPLEGINVPPLFDYSIAQSIQQPLNPNVGDVAGSRVGAVQEELSNTSKPAAKKPRTPRTTKASTSKTKTPDKGQTT